MFFLKEHNTSAKDYVLSLFENHDIVILCERAHPEFTQYELFLEIVKSPYFINNVGNIYTEVGVENMDNRINKFLQSEQQDSLTTRNKITGIFRDADYSPFWDCYNYPWFLSQIHKVNQKLPGPKKIRLHPSDASFSWSEIKTAEEYTKFDKGLDDRDSIMAKNIITRFDSISSDSTKRHKALIIMNFRHAFLKDFQIKNSKESKIENVGRYLSEKYGNNVASVYIMGLAYPKSFEEYTIVKDGLWDATFEKSEKLDIGFNLEGSPFGSEEFDVVPSASVTEKLTYQDMFTGLIFYKPIQEHRFITGWKGFITDDFIPEMRRRTIIYNEAMDDELTNEELEEQIWISNVKETRTYNNLEAMRKKIDEKKNGL